MLFTDGVFQLYRRMFLIRCVEERIQTEYAGRNIRMPVHLSIGQEAVAAGVLMVTLEGDCCVSTHRCHAHYLAKGGDLQAMIDELYSLESGCCRSYGGSMHLFDKDAGFWGSGAIVGGSIPLAVGIGLALKQRGTDSVSIGFTGDGGTDQGVFYESLNLAAVLRLPVLFVVENNGYAIHAPQGQRQARPNVVAKAAAFGVEGILVDGNDALVVTHAAQWILRSIRATSRPYLLEAVTHRTGAHCGPGKRPENESAAWKGSDPLVILKNQLTEDAPALGSRFADLEAAVRREVGVAFTVAKARFATANAIAGLEAPPPPKGAK